MNGYSSDVPAVTSPAAAIEAQEQSLAREALQNLAAQLWAAGHTRTWYRESKYTKTNPSGQAPAADTSSNTGVSMTNANNGYIAPTLTVTRSGGHIQVRAYVNCPSGGTYTIHYPVVNGTIVGGTTTWIQG